MSATTPMVNSGEGDGLKSITSVFFDKEGNAQGYIEQGPAFIRFLAFCAGCGSLVCLVLHFFNLLNIFRPVTLILHVYLAIFALTSILFEAPPEYVAKVNGANAYYDFLVKHCGFMCNNAGRGMFYIFQATLWMSFYSGMDLIILGASAGLTVVGILSILMHYGILPQHVATKALAFKDQISRGSAGGASSA